MKNRSAVGLLAQPGFPSPHSPYIHAVRNGLRRYIAGQVPEPPGYIEYTTKLRMDYAKEQLGATDRSIKEICHDAGYQDPNYFSRIFKKWTGMTPTEYRGGGSI